MKKFLYSKMIWKGGKLLIKLTVSFIVAFFTSEQIAHNLGQLGLQVDPDTLGLALTGALTSGLEMLANFKKHGGAERVSDDISAVKEKVLPNK